MMQYPGMKYCEPQLHSIPRREQTFHYVEYIEENLHADLSVVTSKSGPTLMPKIGENNYTRDKTILLFFILHRLL